LPYENPYGSGGGSNSSGRVEKVSQMGVGGRRGQVMSEVPPESDELFNGVTLHCGTEGEGISFLIIELVQDPESDPEVPVRDMLTLFLDARGDRVDIIRGLKCAKFF